MIQHPAGIDRPAPGHYQGRLTAVLGHRPPPPPAPAQQSTAPPRRVQSRHQHKSRTRQLSLPLAPT